MRQIRNSSLEYTKLNPRLRASLKASGIQLKPKRLSQLITYFDKAVLLSKIHRCGDNRVIDVLPF